MSRDRRIIPTTYAEWCALLDRFRDGDDSVLEDMAQGSIAWTNVVAERWTVQVTVALNERLRRLSLRLQRALDAARGDTFAVSNALLDARRALSPLRALVALPCLNEQLRAHLESEVEHWAKQTQQSLEKSAQADRTSQGRLAKALRDNPLTLAAVGTKPPDDSPPAVRRRILL